jgi:RNA-directed DNA polymerase
VLLKKGRVRRLGDLETPEKIRNLQRELYQKAKDKPEFRFYSLYDKVYRDDILDFAYRLAELNHGAAGVDGVTFENIGKTEGGRKQLLATLKEELRTKTYRPKPVRRVYILKPDGGQRPLGIPCLRDRVAQTAAKLVLEPIFEADFPPNEYGYRPGHGAHDAIKLSHQLLKEGYTDVVDADLSKYFDTIPHRELMRSVSRRVSDGAILKLVKMWLEAPVQEATEEGSQRMSGSGGQGIGTPQGGVISPLLANIYMRRFLLAWERWGLTRRLGAQVINYADDFVILCRDKAAEALAVAREILQRMKLTLNEEKTRLVNARRGSFDFLGYTFGPCYAVGSGRVYLGAKPSKKRVQRIVRAVGDFLRRNHEDETPQEVIRRVNSRLLGWANYYSYGTLSDAYGVVDRAVADKVRAWLSRKFRVEGAGTRRFPDETLWGAFKLVNLRSVLAAQRRPKAHGEARPRAGCGKSARPVR